MGTSSPALELSEDLVTSDYAASLRLLKDLHSTLSTQRTELDQEDRRQRDRLVDLEAHVHYLRQTLEMGPEQVVPTAPLPIMRESRHLTLSENTPENTDPAASTWSLDGGVPSNSLPYAPTLEIPALSPMSSGRTPVHDYSGAMVAARHWQMVARQLLQELQALSPLVRIDSLTGLPNRRSFDEHLPREMAAAQRTGRPFCLLMIDIDHFKRLNDTYGHPTGDEVLRSVAACIVGCIRPADHVARYGGEEFAVVLGGAHAAEALAVAERIRTQIALAQHGPQPVTVSIGVAQYYPQQHSQAELLADSDRALYLAKQSGRNRTHAADPSLSG